MNTPDKIKKLRNFSNEADFRIFLIDFLKKRGFKDVFHTHQYGRPEMGKDIIAKFEHPIEGNEWYSFVVKKGRIAGGTNEIETIKNQIKQSFEYPYKGIDGSEIKINKVKVVTNENFTSGAQDVINSSQELKLFNNFEFWWDEKLIPMIDEYYSDFWLPGDIFLKEYSRTLISKINNEVEIRDLSLKNIDDKKVQRLVNIFIQPELTTTILEYDDLEKKKVIKQKRISVNHLITSEQNILLSGEQGSGKTRVLNTIAKILANTEALNKNKRLPVKLKAPDLVDNSFDFESIIISNVKLATGEFFDVKIFKSLQLILLIDDLDLLNNANKEKLMVGLTEFCQKNNFNYIITYRKSDFDIDKKTQKITIHNFNSTQVESFIDKYFDGNTRGKKFIKILRESDILSKLPTTPLTITLLSLLYDENNYEIPATLSDIYSDFTSVLLGKLDIVNRTDLLEFNMKRRLFSALALKMLKAKIFEISYSDFDSFINNFLEERGYQKQTSEDLNDIIEKSGILYLDNTETVGFKQNAFVEFMASLEIYHHSREENYSDLINNFNDVNWQNTAIFYAGHSKELAGMIDDVITKSPNNDLKDWFINTGGMGYLSQALYQTKPSERKKLVLKALDNLIKSFYQLKKNTELKDNAFYKVPLPLILGIVAFWFTENFKSITLKKTLLDSFDDLINKTDDFDNNFKLLMISTTLMNPYIEDDSCFTKLIERENFINHHILPLVADMILDTGLIESKNVNPDFKTKIEKEIKKKKGYLKVVLKEPAYRFTDNDFSFETKSNRKKL